MSACHLRSQVVYENINVSKKIWRNLYSNHLSRSTIKPTKWRVRPAKTQISMGIRLVWSVPSLCAQWIAKDPRCRHADSEDWSDWADAQAELSLRWAHTSFCWFCHLAAHFMLFQWESHLAVKLWRMTQFSLISSQIVPWHEFVDFMV